MARSHDPAGTEVDPAALTRHAAAVDRVADVVSLGRDAAGQVRLGADAYGQLCQALPAMLEPVHELADRLLSEVGASLSATAGSLRAAAHGYDDADAHAVRRFGNPG